jgi:hypothetical protein
LSEVDATKCDLTEGKRLEVTAIVGDISGDGDVNDFDIDPFIALLTRL